MSTFAASAQNLRSGGWMPRRAIVLTQVDMSLWSKCVMCTKNYHLPWSSDQANCIPRKSLPGRQWQSNGGLTNCEEVHYLGSGWITTEDQLDLMHWSLSSHSQALWWFGYFHCQRKQFCQKKEQRVEIKNIRKHQFEYNFLTVYYILNINGKDS